ncbi:MAG: beta-1,6-N-acetylglucosaminyltransferase [Pisciglobus halotolerans]|nr:beta-1,6-N-acetylglucosaminyltransferase [Pisciglobus halotolerans]
MRHAYMIIAHNNFDILKKILKLLDHERNDFYIHLDKKIGDVDQEQFQGICRYSTVSFTKRLSIYWGDYSQVACEMLLLSTASANGDYGYYHLISGVDFPLKDKETILTFFDQQKGKEFVQFDDETKKQKNVKDRLKVYHIFEKYYKDPTFLGFATKALNKVFMIFQNSIGIDRTRKNPYTIKYGSNWFSITGEFADFVLENEKWVEKTFRRTCCGDESLIQTLIYNSEFYENLYDRAPKEDYRTCLRKIDWQRGNPYTWTHSNYTELIESDDSYLFARKFNLAEDEQVINKLYTRFS